MYPLGGLAGRRPPTALAFLVGAVAICGLPPLNGFVSELFVYLGLFRMIGSDRIWVMGAIGAPALALIGALALACFVKAHGAVFLGQARSSRVARAHDPGLAMLGPMALLGIACTFIGLAPALVSPALQGAVAAWAPEVGAVVEPLDTLAPLHVLSVTGVALLALTGAAAVLLVRGSRKAPIASATTWDCGYAAPSPRMQYSASSFAQTLVAFFSWALWPEVHRGAPGGLFPAPAAFHSHVPDTVLDRAVLPMSRGGARALGWLRWMQHGNVHLYIVYMLAAIVVLVLVSR
jgi:hydrogenase-4 component B